MDKVINTLKKLVYLIKLKKLFASLSPGTLPTKNFLFITSVGEEQYENVVPIETLGINEIKALDKKEQVDYLINKIKDLDIPRNLENGNIAISKL